jgi:hypothetical protein
MKPPYEHKVFMAKLSKDLLDAANNSELLNPRDLADAFNRHVAQLSLIRHRHALTFVGRTSINCDYEYIDTEKALREEVNDLQAQLKELRLIRDKVYYGD